MPKIFSWSWSLGRLRGVDIRFHFSVLFSIPIAYYLFKPADFRGAVEALLWVGGFLLFIFLHELGHTFAAQLAGVEVKSVFVWLLGGLTHLAYKPEKPAHNLFIAAAGPLVNMVLAFLCVAAYILLYIFFLPYSDNVELFLWVQTFANLFFSLALLNVILIGFNLLPVYPLDGGNILHAVMEMLFGKPSADWITLVVSIPFLFILIIFGIVTRDYILLGFCVIMALAVSSLNRSLLRRINLGVNYLFRRAGYYYMLGDYERAAQHYTHDIEKHPAHLIDHYLARASCYLLMGQKERALADIDRALKMAPNHAFAMELRGEVYALEKNYDAALELFSRAQNINPHWAVPYFDRASILLDRSEFQPALEELNKAISLQGRMPLFYLVRSLAHFRLGNLESARKDQNLAVQFSPADALVMADINLMLYENNLDWAEDFYTRILSKNPRDVLALHGRADACRMNNEHLPAIDSYTRAIEIDPREVRLYLGRGKSYLALNESEKAKTDFEKAKSLTDKLHQKRQAEELIKTLKVFPSDSSLDMQDSLSKYDDSLHEKPLGSDD
ncbi:MAG: tetratricopeptide repeat protein [Chloroflexi bacterium]|nr:tetratricopeptide repeat protein [Chloroflexota bacterium]